MGRIRRKAEGWSWDDAAPREYTSGAERRVLVGPDDGATQVELRYFLIPAGGSSSLERHPHEHAVVVVHGQAEVQIGDEVSAVAAGDVVFVASGELHQFRTVGDEPLGFFCSVSRTR
jgi:quercetin dioxygenase-like cupin family protein